MSSIATIAAVSTAVVAVASTAYTVISSSSKGGGGGGQQQQMQPQPVQMPAVPEPVEAPKPVAVPEPEAVPEKKTAATAEAPDPARGIAGTIATGGLGDTSDTKLRKKTLLGS